MEKNKTQKVKLIIAAVVILIIAIAVAVRYIIYQKVGEKNMPYNISKIIVVSTATKYEEQGDKKADNANEEEGSDNSEAEENQDQTEPAEDENQQNEEEQNDNQQTENQENDQNDNSIWKFDVIQTNDLFLSIEKIEENIKKDEKIKSVSIENIKVEESPQNGNIIAFMPNSLDGDRYSYNDEYIVKNKLTYRGAQESNYKNLQICENGGIIGISFANVDLGQYTSGEDTEITYDGTILSKMGITDENLKSKISFDLVIELDDGKKYVGKVVVEIKCENLVEEGRSQIEITDFNDVIFKRK